MILVSGMTDSAIQTVIVLVIVVAILFHLLLYKLVYTRVFTVFSSDDNRERNIPTFVFHILAFILSCAVLIGLVALKNYLIS
jgi:hypothetical protein